MKKFISASSYIIFCILEFILTSCVTSNVNQKYAPKASDWSSYTKSMPFSCSWRSTLIMYITTAIFILLVCMIFHHFMNIQSIEDKWLLISGYLVNGLVLISTIVYTFILPHENGVDLLSLAIVGIGILIGIFCFVKIIITNKYQWFQLGIILQGTIIIWVTLLFMEGPSMC